MEQEKQLTSLPENAYRELAPGEEYTPMLPASAAPAEVTPYSVGMGIELSTCMWMSIKPGIIQRP